MFSTRELRISATGVQSLVWNGDELIDWAGGGTRFSLDGETVSNPVSYGDTFDAAAMSPSGEFAVTYTRLGTKGLVLHRGKIIREINRSYYHADVYEYPIALARLKNGREVLIHCPEEYCRLEIDDVQSGERLTDRRSRKPADFFQSRLAVSADGRTLASAGWVWHPVDVVRVFDIEAALQDPLHLDGTGLGIDAWAEESSATFDCDGRLIVALNGLENDDGDSIATSDSVVEIRTFDLPASQPAKIVRRTGRVGTIMPVGVTHVLGLYGCPTLVEMATGQEIQRWPHIHSGTQTSGIWGSVPLAPPIALDPMRKRCAVADNEGVSILLFG